MFIILKFAGGIVVERLVLVHPHFCSPTQHAIMASQKMAAPHPSDVSDATAGDAA